MPLVKKITTEAGILGIWELLETAEELEQLIQLADNEKVAYRQIKTERRKTEFLTIRILTQLLSGKKVEIEYLPTRKPRLKNDSSFISISHSQNLVAVLIAKKHQVGIDVEQVDRNIGNVAKRFLSDNEADDIQHLTNPQIGKILYWCAKESIFKCTQNQGIQFNTQILIKPFQLSGEGTFRGKLIIGEKIENYKLWYFSYKNNTVVYCVPLNN
jgi:4'-phosphopantetheinyl transferase